MTFWNCRPAKLKGSASGGRCGEGRGRRRRLSREGRLSASRVGRGRTGACRERFVGRVAGLVGPEPGGRGLCPG